MYFGVFGIQYLCWLHSTSNNGRKVLDALSNVTKFIKLPERKCEIVCVEMSERRSDAIYFIVNWMFFVAIDRRSNPNERSHPILNKRFILIFPFSLATLHWAWNSAASAMRLNDSQYQIKYSKSMGQKKKAIRLNDDSSQNISNTFHLNLIVFVNVCRWWLLPLCWMDACAFNVFSFWQTSERLWINQRCLKKIVIACDQKAFSDFHFLAQH